MRPSSNILAGLLLATGAPANAATNRETALAALAPATRAITSLNAGWRFRREDVAGAERENAADGDWQQVTLPHSFNGADGDDGGGYYRGVGWYRRTLVLARAPVGRAWLQFDGAALTTVLFVNGRRIGSHEGGHAGFRFDVTDALRAGDNILAVRVDNAKTADVAPLGGDFTVFGGLYRDVALIEAAPVHVSLDDHGGPGVYVTTTTLDDAQARIAARVLLRNDSPRPARPDVRVSVRDRDGREVATHVQSVRLAARGDGVGIVPLAVPSPHRWNGRMDPYLYTVTAEVMTGSAKSVDRVTVPLGLRTAVFDPQRGFLLNGRSYPLHGVNMFHSGRPGRGLAVTRREIADDMQTLDELGVTAVRMVHFQHPPAAYDEADRRGFAVWTEIGLNGAIDPGGGFQANVAEQMRELIRQNYNHPSVVLWGLGNEIYSVDPAVTRVLRGVQAVAHEEDRSRPTVYAHCCQGDDADKALVSDVIGFNRYFGWYPGQAGTIGAWADGYHAAHPNRAFAVSEYGAGASIRHQQVPAPAENVPESGWHPEQAQTKYHVENWRDLAARPYLFGSFVWVAFDLASDGRREGDRPGINDKGLVSYDRQVRKDAFYWYQANWAAEPMAHIVDGRLDRRTEATTDVSAFTNAAAVTLTVNGRPFGAKMPVDHVVRWADVPLAIGDNVLNVATEGGRAADTVRWVRSSTSPSGATAIPVVRKPDQPPAPAAKPPGQ